jgi:hypothetical protein
MKNLKSLLAIVMVLIIGACLTGCQSAEEKAESERLVSESVSDSERIVSESVSESVVASESVAVSESVAESIAESVLESLAVAESIAVSESVYNEEHAEELAANKEFADWFYDVSVTSEETSGVKVSLKTTNLKTDQIKSGENATLTIGDTDYSSTDFSFDGYALAGPNGVSSWKIETLIIDFSEVTVTEYESLTITINGNTTLTYYPDV